MAEERFIMEILKELQDYYRQKYNPTQVNVLVRQLDQVPETLLRIAVDKWIDTQDDWLPKGSQLLKLAQAISGYPDLRLIPDIPIRPIWIRHQDLKNRYYRSGIFNLADWETLITYSQNVGYTLSARAIRTTLNAILHPQTETECNQYAQWTSIPS